MHIHLTFHVIPDQKLMSTVLVKKQKIHYIYIYIYISSVSFF